MYAQPAQQNTRRQTRIGTLALRAYMLVEELQGNRTNIPFNKPICPVTIVPTVTDGVICPPDMFAAQYTAKYCTSTTVSAHDLSRQIDML